MRQYMNIISEAMHDEAFDRFWWVDGDFEELDEPHADWVINQLSDLSTGDYDDEINHLGETEEEVNQYYIDTRNAVRGGIIKGQRNIVFLDSNKLRTIHKCLKDLLKVYPNISEVTVDSKSFNGLLTGDNLEFFIRKGQTRRSL